MPQRQSRRGIPDSLVARLPTPWFNSLGVFGWGWRAGIEAEAALSASLLDLGAGSLGFKMHGRLPEGTTATESRLTSRKGCAKKGVVGKVVEFMALLSTLSVHDPRPTIANMVPNTGRRHHGLLPGDNDRCLIPFTARSHEQIAPARSVLQRKSRCSSQRTPHPNLHSGKPENRSRNRVEPTVGRTQAPRRIAFALKQCTSSFVKVGEGDLPKHVPGKNNGARLNSQRRVVIAATPLPEHTSIPP